MNLFTRTVNFNISFNRRKPLFFMGPGWIVMMADFDAASIITAAQTGVSFGTGLIWFFLVLTIPLFFIQYASGRVGLATGSGLGSLIKNNFSKRAGYAASMPMFVSDILTYTAEYFGLALGFTILGVPLLIGMPVAYTLHIAIVFSGRYRSTEKILLGVSSILVVSFLAAGFSGSVVPDFRVSLSTSRSFLFLIAANAGAVVMPFMLFFQASATGIKGGTTRGVRYDTLIGAIFSEILMIVVETEFSGAFGSTGTLSSVGSFLHTFVSGTFGTLFGLGIIAASFLALVVVSLGSTWGVSEVIGLSRRGQLMLYSLESLPGVIIPFIFPDIIGLILDLMVVFVFVLMLPGVTLGLIAGKEKIMGSSVLKRWEKIGYWGSLMCVLFLGLVSL